METRVLPEPDRFATCPDDGKILEYYRGVFEAVFVSLHPFIKPFPASRTLFESPTLPDRATVAAHCEAVPWSAIMQLTGLPSLSAVDIGLRTGIHALNKGFAREDYARTLQGLEKSEGIICPAEGYFSDMSHDAMLKSIRSLGHQWVWVGDEHCTERKLYWIDDLCGEEADATLGHRNVFTPDHSLLWTTHWDSHFSFVCGAKEHLDAVVLSAGLEGFYCDKETSVFWSTSPSPAGAAS